MEQELVNVLIGIKHILWWIALWLFIALFKPSVEVNQCQCNKES
jgi:hypothetical protein